MNSIYRWALALSLILVVVFQAGCGAGAALSIDAGQVIEVARGATSLGINRALYESQNTMVLTNSARTMFMFVWGLNGNGAAFWVFDTVRGASLTRGPMFEAIAAQNGNLTGARSMSWLIEHLRARGWEVIRGSEVPDTVRSNIQQLFSISNLGLPTFVLMWTPSDIGEADIYELINPSISQ